MDFEHSEKVKTLLRRLEVFFEEHIELLLFVTAQWVDFAVQNWFGIGE